MACVSTLERCSPMSRSLLVASLSSLSLSLPVFGEGTLWPACCCVEDIGVPLHPANTTGWLVLGVGFCWPALAAAWCSADGVRSGTAASTGAPLPVGAVPVGSGNEDAFVGNAGSRE
jgi:hypothetical protein